MSRVGIVVPVYRTRPFLRRAVESALAQTRPPDELIVVDDGDPDASLEEIRDLIERGSVRALVQANAGVAAARNRGWRAGRAEHLLFLDSDDELAPQALEKLLAAADPADPAGLTYADVTRIDLRGEPLLSGPPPARDARLHLEGNLLPALLFGGFFQIHGVLLPRALLEASGGFDERFLCAEDFHFHLRCFALGARARFVSEPLARYRIHPASKSADTRRMRIWERRSIAEAASVAPAAFATALPEAVRELDWITARVRADGEEHLRRCRDHVARLEERLRPAERERSGRKATPSEPPASRGWLGAVLSVCAGPEPVGADVATACVRLFDEGAAEAERLWSAARERLGRCEVRARRLERALARRALRASG